MTGQQAGQTGVRAGPVLALTGSTGYVGGMLIEPLARLASEVRCISRRPGVMKDLPFNAVTRQADTNDPESLKLALSGADVAYYLVHSLGENDNYVELEARSARNFAESAATAGIRRIIYLGALAQSDLSHTSAHIESRNRVGEILGSTGVPVTEFRAPVIIGAGSMPFEVIRALVERLPVMVTPRWVKMKLQPIAAMDLVRYLTMALEDESDKSHVYEIGGSDVTDYAELMHTYARERGLRRFMVPVPVITPRLSSLWLKLVTPAHYRIGRRIVDSAAHSSIVRDTSALKDFAFRPVSFREAVHDALANEDANLNFLDRSINPSASVEKMRIGNKFVERRRKSISATHGDVFDAVAAIGGTNGWLWGDWLWRLRGTMDRLAGGPGLRRRNLATRPVVGKTLDFWTVERFELNRLTLRADMKLPGAAWLDLSVREISGLVFIEQTAVFDPRGLLGIIYWFALYPLHSLVFTGMLRNMANRIEKNAQ